MRTGRRVSILSPKYPILAVLAVVSGFAMAQGEVVHVKATEPYDAVALNRVAAERAELIIQMRDRQDVIRRAIDTPVHDTPEITALRAEVQRQEIRLQELRTKVREEVLKVPAVKELIDLQKAADKRLLALTQERDALLPKGAEPKSKDPR